MFYVKRIELRYLDYGRFSKYFNFKYERRNGGRKVYRIIKISKKVKVEYINMLK